MAYNRNQLHLRGIVTRNFVTTRKEPDFLFFNGNKSPFSQQRPVAFAVDGIVFNCAEQYVMYKKAALFKDEAMKLKIISSNNPVHQKKFGRQVKNFDKDVWNKEAENIVKTASKAKFSQNEGLKMALIGTYPCILAEASQASRTWGIGLSATNPKALNKLNWRGLNKLGYILTEVRDEILVKDTLGKIALSYKWMAEYNRKQEALRSTNEVAKQL